MRDNIIPIVLLTITAFVLGVYFGEINGAQDTPDNQKRDSFNDPQATAEQLVILHYIKHHIGSKENEMMFEHSDGIITQEDYQTVLERVHRDFNINGLNETYTRDSD